MVTVRPQVGHLSAVADRTASGQRPADDTRLEAELRRLAGSVPDPELPVLTLEELGVLRGVHVHGPGRVEVELTPTYTGCPAIEAMSSDIEQVLHDHGIPECPSSRSSPPPGRRTTSARRAAASWPSSASPRPVPQPTDGPVPLTLSVRCPHCGSADTELLSRFSSTACKALRRCVSCREPFDHFKEL